MGVIGNLMIWSDVPIVLFFLMLVTTFKSDPRTLSS